MAEPHDELNKLYNEAHEATQRLAEKLSERGYAKMADHTDFIARRIDRDHHDWMNLILDPA